MEHFTLSREQRFEQLYAAHYAPVLAYAARRVRDLATAEEVAAETFAVAWRRFDEASAGGLPWLYRAAGYKTLERQRTDGRSDTTLDRVAQLAHESSTPLSDHVATSLWVRGNLNALSLGDQEVLRLTYWEGLNARETGAVLGCSAATAAVRLHRARRRLRAQLLRDDGGPPDLLVTVPKAHTSRLGVAR